MEGKITRAFTIAKVGAEVKENGRTTHRVIDLTLPAYSTEVEVIHEARNAYNELGVQIVHIMYLSAEVRSFEMPYSDFVKHAKEI